MVQIVFYEKKRKFEKINVNLKEIFYDGLKILKCTRICMENHSTMTGWQKLLAYKSF